MHDRGCEGWLRASATACSTTRSGYCPAPDETPDETPDELALRAAAFELLRDGPLSEATLLDRLLPTGALEPWRLLDDESLLDVLDEALLDTDDCWTTDDGIVMLLATALDGVVFTHRVTPDELDLGELQVTPDFVIIDWDDSSLVMSGGGVVATR